MKVWGIVFAASLAAAFAAKAGHKDRLIEKAEMSMLVSGGIDMRPDGSVERYSIDHSEKLSAAVVQLIGAQVSQWRFEPVLVDGKPVAAHTNMSLRIVAKPADEQNFNVRIQSVSFSGGSDDADDHMSVLKKTSLGPMVRALVSSGVDAADLYIALKVGTDGKVQDAVVEQVNLFALGGDREMESARKVLGDSTMEVVRKWTFRVPAREPDGEPYWSGVLPVTFRVSGDSTQEYGQWKTYVPGPCASVPWRELNSVTEHPCDAAAPEGELTLDGSGPKLLTPLMKG